MDKPKAKEAPPKCKVDSSSEDSSWEDSDSEDDAPLKKQKTSGEGSSKKSNGIPSKKPSAGGGSKKKYDDAPATHPNKKQKVDSDADSLLAKLDSLKTQGDAAAIIQGMGTHSQHPGVQQHACAALKGLAYNNAGKKVKKGNQVKIAEIAEAGGIGAVVAAMKTHIVAAMKTHNGKASLQQHTPLGGKSAPGGEKANRRRRFRR